MLYFFVYEMLREDSRRSTHVEGVGARSVVVTYKLPMLVPRVRFPVCAEYFIFFLETVQ